MAGRMGSDTVTMKKSMVVAFDESTNMIWVTGPVPGSRYSLVRLEVTDQKDAGIISYLSGGMPKVVEPVVEPVAEAVEEVKE